ncbi:MAG TPA: DEAD/DEAH box helicase family protein [Gallionella sp.]|nr:DEAD/DEAH box helicase family protein [Gallionella sp.]
MADLKLKSYQSAALSALSDFLRASSQVGVASAFQQQVGRAYESEPFGAIPCVCLRIPTGGGKTLMASHAIVRMAREWQSSDAPVAVWLVPSEAIRSQTLAALQSPGHPYRAALEEAYGQRVQVCDLDRVSTLAPTDWGRQAIMVVATIQSFRVEQTDTRNVYAFSEAFERHFKALSAERLTALSVVPDAFVTGTDAAGNAMLHAYIGQPRFSLANWLALQNPLVVVDEAHNARTDNSFTALKRLNPSAILELTATPIAHKTNVLYHVSAQELQAEQMIKLPITLSEHPEGWEAAVFGAVQAQKWLETEAQQAQAAGDAYVRPIVLFQAQNTNDAVPPDALRQYLIAELHIPGEQIAIATGSQRDLEGVDISSPACPLRYIITVQALREGWDCPFAYILCSLQPLSSATAVEQLLGRVLRMPYASKRQRDSLNRAYAHVCEATFAHAAGALVDRLVTNMGFEALDVASMITPQMPLFDGVPQPAALPPVTTVLKVAKDTGLLHLAGVSVAPAANGKGVEVTLTGHVDEAVEKILLETERNEKKREAIREKITQHNAVVAAETAPAMRGVKFVPIPPLGYRSDAQATLFPLEREAVLESVELNLLAQTISLPGFQVVEQDNAFEIYLDNDKVKMRAADAHQLALDGVNVNITADDLVRWLNREARQPDIVQSHLLAYLHAVVNHLVNEQRVGLNTLARMRFILAKRIDAQISDMREAAAKSQFRQLVLDGGWQVEPDWTHAFNFETGIYPAPAGSRYAGRWDFRKHYYPVIANLKDKGEEFDCARMIDRHPQVKHWVRNLDSEPGFWLPVAKGRFFPDFIAELTDGRIAVIEYKGAHLRNDPQEIEKRQVGELWAAKSDGKCLFRFVYLDNNGVGMEAQVNAVLAG